MELNELHKLIVGARFYAHHDKNLRCLYPALGLGGETGEVLEKVKKAIRDDGFPDFPLATERKASIAKELGDVLFYLACLAEDLELTLQDVADIWIEKYCGRVARQTLSGDGDDR